MIENNDANELAKKTELADLPAELLEKAGSKLDLTSLLALSKTCRKYREVLAKEIVSRLSLVKKLYVGHRFSFFQFGKKTYVWGDNRCGQLGLGDEVVRLEPVPFQPALFAGQAIKQLVLGEEYSFAKLVDGSWWCWGSNHSGQLGLGDKHSRLNPVKSESLCQLEDQYNKGLKQVLDGKTVLAQALNERLVSEGMLSL